MQKTRLKMLQEMPIFGGVDDTTLDFILHDANSLEVEAGTFFFREGERDNAVYVLEQGHVAVFRYWENTRYKLRELRKGDCFGEMALMDFQPRSAEVVAIVKCRAIQISAAQLAMLYERRPDQYTMIYMNLGREVCRRLREADKRLFIHEITASNKTGS
ncbi:MAG: cyclic nucleotide-binding domain-containing protein [Candidatus Thiodiazotropha sp. (ex Monitilora ramsayi)]|nr:cyclic nucleotide-binding domain-containing protein [Candidatus Thiodiazotropha sp. (ex Monitilora ramsayi)]